MSSTAGSRRFCVDQRTNEGKNVTSNAEVRAPPRPTSSPPMRYATRPVHAPRKQFTSLGARGADPKIQNRNAFQ